MSRIDLTTPPPPVAPGLYGKLPILGDFVSRRLPAEFIRPWDVWIQAALSASRAHLGAHWLEIYLTSPIWRFVLGPGNCGKAALAGILMPSVDKVGRYFPLTLAAVIDDPRQAPAGLMTTAASWFDDLEQLALSALTNDIRLDDLDRELQERRLSPAPTAPPATGCGTGARNGHLIFQTGMEKLDRLADAFTELNARLLPRSWPAFTLWSTNGSERLGPSLVVYDGLPPAEDFSCFLTGRWSSRGNPHPIETCASIRPRGAGSGTAIRWRSSARTTAGKVRELNEDAFLEKPESGLWAVADGMGGHLAGDEAAGAVVDALGSVSPEDTIGSFSASVAARLENTNAELLRRSRKNDPHQIMGSTVVVMLAVGRHCAALWAGDSRLYRLRGGLLSQLTRDHSMISEIELQGAPRPDTPAGNALSNIVTRALGAEPELALDTLAFEARPGDSYLLCSDGLVKEIRPREITDIISGPDCNASSRALIDLALARGARDNVTVVVITAEADTEVAS
jgi:type VI secretion system protein ImpM